jgi:hypothetical protein
MGTQRATERPCRASFELIGARLLELPISIVKVELQQPVIDSKEGGTNLSGSHFAIFADRFGLAGYPAESLLLRNFLQGDEVRVGPRALA